MKMHWLAALLLLSLGQACADDGGAQGDSLDGLDVTAQDTLDPLHFLGTVPEGCLTGSTCVTDAECEEGARCNTSLRPPGCQRVACAVKGEACNDPWLYAEEDPFKDQAYPCAGPLCAEGHLCLAVDDGSMKPMELPEGLLPYQCWPAAGLEGELCDGPCAEGLACNRGALGWGGAGVCTVPVAIPAGLKWIDIKGGTFQMGCSTGDPDCGTCEFPVHAVTLSNFKLLETEVTEAQYLAVMGVNPSCNVGGGGGTNNPVECVTWNDAKIFCEALGGRLPTEAEFEYGARGGKATRYYCGTKTSCLNGIAWYSGNSGGKKHFVAGKAPNAYGLFDMLGNVWEWTGDWKAYYDSGPKNNPKGPATGDSRLGRGGSFVGLVYSLRVSARFYDGPSDCYYNLGFRCAKK